MKIRSLIRFSISLAVVLAVLAASSTAVAQRRASAQVGAGCGTAFDNAYEAIEAIPLTAFEEAELSYLREEEKLARDVYLTLAELWQLPIFSNIAGAEQRHMDLVSRLFTTYETEDPIVDDSIGVFADPSLASLYGDLVDSGSQSLTDALIVGATIEDLDLADLVDLINSTENQHITLVAHNLAKGSRNHLRAFIGALTAQDIVYLPQYLDQVPFDEIVASDFERGMVYGADGSTLSACGGGRGWGMRRGRHGGGQNNGDCDQSGNQNPPGNGSGSCDGTGPNGNGNGNGNGGQNNGQTSPQVGGN